MWIKKKHYIELNRELMCEREERSRAQNRASDYQRRYEESQKEVKQLKEKTFSRSQILSEWDYFSLVRFAENEYGIRPENYSDKSELILEIVDVESQLKKIGAAK